MIRFAETRPSKTAVTIRLAAEKSATCSSVPNIPSSIVLISERRGKPIPIIKNAAEIEYVFLILQNDNENENGCFLSM